MLAFDLVRKGRQEDGCSDANEHANSAVDDEDPLPWWSTCTSLVEVFDSSVSNQTAECTRDRCRRIVRSCRALAINVAHCGSHPPPTEASSSLLNHKEP
jgi:hypothetical protein